MTFTEITSPARFPHPRKKCSTSGWTRKAPADRGLAPSA